MKLPVYQIDAFASRVFAGNPAVVCCLDEWLEDSVLLAIAAEHNISTTAFLVERGGEFEITSLDTEGVENPADPKELASISDALDQLAKVEPTLAELVDLKFFCGFSFAEIGALQKLSERTVQRRWEKARIYLHRSLRSDLPL